MSAGVERKRHVGRKRRIGRKRETVGNSTNFNGLGWFNQDIILHPNGKWMYSAETSRVAQWNVKSHRAEKVLRQQSSPLALSSDGRTLACLSLGKGIELLDAESLQHIKTLPLHTLQSATVDVKAIAFNPTGTLLAVATDPSTYRTAKGNLWHYSLTKGRFPDLLKLIDTSTGKSVRVFTQGGQIPAQVAWSPDGKTIAIADERDGIGDEQISLWNVGLGIKTYHISGHAPFAFSSDGHILLYNAEPGSVSLWDIASRKKMRNVRVGTNPNPYRVAISPNGKYFVTMASIQEDSTLKLEIWSADSGENIRTISVPRKSRWDAVNDLSFSADNNYLITGASSVRDYPVQYSDKWFGAGWTLLGASSVRDYPVQYWSIATGVEQDRLGANGDTISHGRGIFVLHNLYTNTHVFSIYAATTREFIRSIKLTSSVGGFCVSPDDNTIAVLDQNRLTIRIFDSKSGNQIADLQGHRAGITFLCYSPDSHFLLTGGLDATARIWDLHNKKQVAALVSYGNASIVSTPEGFYMATKEGLSAVAFRLGEAIFPFEQFDLKLNRPDKVLTQLGYAPQHVVAAYQRAYEKRLKKMGFKEEMLAADFHLPEVSINFRDLPSATKSRELTFMALARDTKYKLDRLIVYVNDVPILGSRGVNLRDRNSSGLTQEIKLVLTPGRNRVQVSVLNSAGAESLRQTFEVVYLESAPKPDLYVVAIGVSNYRYSKAHPDKNVDLKYASKDANDIADYLQHLTAIGTVLRSKGSLVTSHSRNARTQAQRRSTSATVMPHNFQKVHVLRIVNGDATRENVMKAHEFLLKSKPQDHVIVFFAGHGMLDKNFDYYFCTTETDPSNLADTALPYDRIETILDGIPSRQKLLLMDTCHSGEVDKDEPIEFAFDTHGGQRGLKLRGFGDLRVTANSGLGLTNSFQLLQEQFADLQRGSGTVVISAAGGVEAAQEDEHWNNGAFTKTLLEGLKNRKADKNKDGQISVAELRDYVTREVPILTRNAQKPTSRRESVEFDFFVD